MNGIILKTFLKTFYALTLFYSGITYATCQLDTSDPSTLQAATSITVPLSAQNISAGVDLTTDQSSASVLYTQTIKLPIPDIALKCDKSAPFVLNIVTSDVGNRIVSDPYSSWYWSAKTSLSGLFFSYWAHNNPEKSFIMETATILPSASTARINMSSDATFDIGLAKSGTLTSGIIDGSSLPNLFLSVGQSDSLIQLVQISFSGSLAISQPTCVTPDYTVQLGHWSADRFKAIGSTSPWVDASIRLTGCGNFYGFYNDVPAIQNSWSSTGSVTGSPVNNQWSLNLSPVTSIIDSSQGIMGIDDSVSGTATGIGIQISAGTTDVAEGNLVNFSTPLNGIFETSGLSTVTIPLSARYIQTEDTVTPGKADGKLVYTLSYY